MKMYSVEGSCLPEAYHKALYILEHMEGVPKAMK